MSHPPETGSGIVTQWLPMTTAWPASQPCSSTFLAHVPWGNPGNLAFAFDPTYGISVDPNIHCLPPEATTWWWQPPDTGTTVLLGPIVCPEAYTTATTTAINSLSTLIGCCPSNYEFVALQSAPSPYQCISSVTAGQVITYANGDDGWAITTGSQATATTVGAIQINGYIFAPSASSAASTPISTSLSTLSLLPSAGSGQSPSSNTSSALAGNKGLSSGAVIGISVGLSSLILITTFAICFIFFRRYRSHKMHNKTAYELGADKNYTNSSVRPPVEIAGNQKFEVDGANMRHEM